MGSPKGQRAGTCVERVTGHSGDDQWLYWVGHNIEHHI